MDIVTYALSKKYVAESLDGLGALKGANCVIESIDTVPEGNRVTFSWTGTDGTIETSTMIVENGIDGNNGTNGIDGVGISKIEKIDIVGLKDTYRITFTDNTTYDYSITNGQKGEQGIQGLRGEKGEQGEQGVQGIQGIKGEKGDDGYPFLIYKEYSDVSEFNKNDFPEIGLMFMIVADGASSFPVYRYTGDDTVPYRYVTDLTGGEGIKGEKGDKGEQGEQGVQGENGKDGITYIPTIGTVTSGDIASATVVTKDETSTAEFSFVLPKGDNVTVDTILSDTSENPVQNKVIKQAIDNKADKTVATTSADGLMSAEDKGKLDAFEITTTGGKLHDKDIATTDLIPTTLPANGGNADTVGGVGIANLRQITQTLINTLPAVPNGEGDFLVNCDTSDTSFPYKYGHLSIRYGSYTGEYVATFRTTGNDNKVYYNTYLTNHWHGWINVADGGKANSADTLTDWGTRTVTNANDAPFGFCAALDCENAPNPFWSTILTTGSSSATKYKTQIAFPWAFGAGENKIRYRCENDGEWGSWINVADGGNADTVDGKHADDFATSVNPTIIGGIKVVRPSSTSTIQSIFSISDTIRIRNLDSETSQTNNYADIVVTPSGVFTEKAVNGVWQGRKELLTSTCVTGTSTIVDSNNFVSANFGFTPSAVLYAVYDSKTGIDDNYRLALNFNSDGFITQSRTAPPIGGGIETFSYIAFR